MLGNLGKITFQFPRVYLTAYIVLLVVKGDDTKIST
jgi:hypothetical protein